MKEFFCLILFLILTLFLIFIGENLFQAELRRGRSIEDQILSDLKTLKAEIEIARSEIRETKNSIQMLQMRMVREIWTDHDEVCPYCDLEIFHKCFKNKREKR